MPSSVIERVPLARLVPWSDNPKINHDVAGIRKSMDRFGYLSRIVVQVGTYRVLVGHGRLAALKASGAQEIEVIVADLTDAEASAYSLADNKLAENSETDDDLLGKVLADLQSQNIPLEVTGFGPDELAAILKGSNFEPSSLDEQSRLDEKKKAKCPKCGNEFTP